MKVAVIGANGQLGTDLVKAFESAGISVAGLTRADLDVRNIDSVSACLTELAPTWVINPAAYVNVNLAETSQDEAFAVNGIGAGNVARVAESINAKSVYISTDFIFDGSKPFGDFYQVDDVAGPLNVYGRTKYEGELAVQAATDKALIYRISSVFGSAGSSGKGGNFIEAILKKVRAGETATVIDDNQMTPTYTAEAARVLVGLVQRDVLGVEHGSSLDAGSWFDLAKHAATRLGLGDLVQPVSSEPNPAVKRPKNSALSVEALAEHGLATMPWREAVDAYLAEKGYF